MGRLLRGDAAAAAVRDLTRDRRGGSPSVMLMPLSLVALELAVLAYKAAHKQWVKSLAAIMVKIVSIGPKKLDIEMEHFSFSCRGKIFKEGLGCMSFIPFF